MKGTKEIAIKDTSSNRYDLIDVMKGVLIVLVVLGHTNTPLTKWIYSFHMAAFFAISGYLWNEKHISDYHSVIKYIKNKVIRLYVPFIAVNIIFIILNNWLGEIHVYQTNPDFIEWTAAWPLKQSLSTTYSISDIIRASIKSLLLISGSAQIVSTCWFLSTLFLITIGHMIISLIFKKIKCPSYIVVEVIILALNLTIAYLHSIKNVKIPWGGGYTDYSLLMRRI